MPAENCMVGGCREAAGAVAIRWGGPGGACGEPAGWPGIHGVPAVAGGPGAACCGRPFALACCCAPVWGVQGMSCGDAERCCSPAVKRTLRTGRPNPEQARQAARLDKLLPMKGPPAKLLAAGWWLDFKLASCLIHSVML